MSFMDFARALRANWVVVIATLLLGAGLGAGFAAAQTPKYQSSSSIVIAAQAPADVADANTGASYVQQVTKSYAYVATTEYVLDRVADRLGLDDGAATLVGNVSANVPLDTQVVAITASSSSPTQAARIANAVAATLADSVDLFTPSQTVQDNVVTVTIVQRGTPPSTPISPNIRLSIGIGALLGLAVGLVVAVLRERRTLHRDDED